MLHTNRVLGGILLVSGTTIGAGMLALPVIGSFAGFIPSLLLFILIWALMLMSALFLLDVNLSMKGDINLISLAGKTLGLKGKVVAWVFYLLLLYALTAAYIAGSTPFFVDAISALTGWKIPPSMAFFSLPILFGVFVYFGTLGVDYINRILMVGLIISYFLLIGFLPSHLDPKLLLHQDYPPLLLAAPVIITSFGFSIIIPTLTTYLHHDRKKLRLVLWVGSLIPLLFYVVWQALILGVVPIEGENGLMQAWQKGSSATIPLTKLIKNPWITLSANFFAFFAIVTSFLGVTLSLSDFLTDGLKIKKTWEGKLIAWGLTFIPPLVFVLTYQRGFIVALEYAGVFVAILLILLPAWMALHLKKSFYHQIKGKILSGLLIIFAFLIIIITILDKIGFLKPLIAKYVSS